jgi:hypothetical protein
LGLEVVRFEFVIRPREGGEFNDADIDVPYRLLALERPEEVLNSNNFLSGWKGSSFLGEGDLCHGRSMHGVLIGSGLRQSKPSVGNDAGKRAINRDVERRIVPVGHNISDELVWDRESVTQLGHNRNRNSFTSTEVSRGLRVKRNIEEIKFSDRFNEGDTSTIYFNVIESGNGSESHGDLYAEVDVSERIGPNVRTEETAFVASGTEDLQETGTSPPSRHLIPRILEGIDALAGGKRMAAGRERGGQATENAPSGGSDGRGGSHVLG